jgi:hypothetical protein
MMKTAQRPAYTGKPNFRKSSASGLLLNFSPLRFDDAEVDAGVFPYGADGEEALRSLRQEHWSTHVFRRNGPDEIVAVPVAADAPKLGSASKRIRLKENLGLTASLIRNSLINYLAGLPRPVLNYDPIRFIAHEDILPACLPAGTVCPDWLGVRLLYDMAIRPIYFFKHEPFIAAVFDMRTTRILDRTVAELLADGFSPVGHYVTTRVSKNQDPRIVPRAELLGKVEAVNGSPSLRSSFEVKITNGTVSAWITPSFGMLNCQTESSSNSIASKAWSTLSSSSMSRTQRFGYCKARRSGPALKNLRLCSSCLSGSHSTGPDFDRSSTASLCKASSNLPMAFSSLMPSKHCNRSTSVLVAVATA